MKRLYLLPVMFLMVFIKTALSQQLELQWSKQIGSHGWDWVNALQTDKQGNYYIAGGIAGKIIADTISNSFDNNTDAFIARYDSTGKVLWQKSLGGKYFDNATSLAVTGTKVFVSGMFQDTLECKGMKISSKSYTGGYLAAFTTGGILEQLTTIGNKAVVSFVSLASNDQDRLFMAGLFRDTLALSDKSFISKERNSIFLSEVTPEGKFQNSQAITCNGSLLQPVIAVNQQVLCLAGAFSDSLRIADTTIYSLGGNDFFVSIFNLEGKLLHVIAAGGLGSDVVSAITFLQNGDIGILGSFELSFLLGDQVLKSEGSSDVFLARLDAQGHIKLVTKEWGPADDYGYSLTESPEENLYVAGSFRKGILLTYSQKMRETEEYKAESGFGNAFIAKYNKNGELISSTHLPWTSEDYCKSIIAGSGGKVLAAGNFFQSVKISGQSGIQNTYHASQNEKDIFLAHYIDRCLGFKFKFSNDTLLCKGSSVILHTSDNFDEYLWHKDNSAKPSLIVNTPGAYSLTVTNSYGCKATDSVKVKLASAITVFAGKDSLIMAGNTFLLSDATASNFETLQWSSRGSGLFDNDAAIHPKYIPSDEDIQKGKVALLLKAQNGCGADLDTIHLKILHENDAISAYPNPTFGLVHVISQNEVLIHITVSNSHGEVLLVKDLNGLQRYDLNLSIFPTGVYHIKVSTNLSEKTLSVTKI